MGNVAPVITICGSDEVDEGSPYLLSLGPVVDPGTDTVRQYVIHWGDGHDQTIPAADLPPGRQVTHVYEDGPTNNTITLDLTDEDGTYVAAASTAVRVVNAAPAVIIEVAPAHAPLVGEQVAIHATVTDPSPIDTTAGFVVNWIVTRSGVTYASGSGPDLTFTPDEAGEYLVSVIASDKDGGQGTCAKAVTVIPPTALSGTVWADFNDDGLVDFGEQGISGVTVNLTGTNDLGQPVSRSLKTNRDGAYNFLNLRPGTYSITEATDEALLQYLDGRDVLGAVDGIPVGTLCNDLIRDIALNAGETGLNYNFGERPLPGSPVTGGQSATIGFWQNKNGQGLINAFDGGGRSTRLGDWLAATLPNIFGAQAGDNNLAGKTNDLVASAFQQRFVVKGAKLDAQLMAAALSIYATNSSLGGAWAAVYGFTVTDYGLGNSTYDVGSSGEAFGVANNTRLAVMDILLYADDQAVNGVLNKGNTMLRKMANNVFEGINTLGDIG